MFQGTKLFHSDKGIVEKDFLESFYQWLPFLQEQNIQLLSFDLGPAAECVFTTDYYYETTEEMLRPQKIKAIVRDRLKAVRKAFCGDIAMENLNYYHSPPYQYVCEPEFIAGVIEENDAGLVLDIAHAMVASGNLGWNLKKYLSLLPLHRVREIHVSSPRQDGKVWLDAHQYPDEEQYRLLGEILTEVRADVYVVVEYYADLELIKQAYRTLKELEHTITQ
jgi:uncharacterized protein (UPF0276 family)